MIGKIVQNVIVSATCQPYCIENSFESGNRRGFSNVLKGDVRSNRRLSWALLGLTLYLILCVVGGVLLADGAMHPVRRSLHEDEIAGFRQAVQAKKAKMTDVSIATPDGVVLRGWMIVPLRTNGNAVVVFHGLADNRLGMIGYGELLLAHGFVVLLPDARAHGASGGTLATYGLLERNDIRQWFDFLQSKALAGCVYGMGESMGAGQLLQSLAAGAQFCAVVAESSFSDFREIAYDRMGQPFHLGPWVGRTILRPVVEVAFLRARWKYGLDMQQVSPEKALSKTHIPTLLIHGQIDSNIPVRHSRRMHLLDPETVLWEVPHADHCGALATAPEEFEMRLLGWFGGNSSSQPTLRMGVKSPARFALTLDSYLAK